jgi:hypothetical protein
VNRLGNLTLLELPLNRGLRGISDWATKAEAYARSALQMPRGVALAEGWSPDAIRHRQARLAELAVEIWRGERDEQG